MTPVQSVSNSQVQSTKFFDPQNCTGAKVGTIAVTAALAAGTALDIATKKAKFSKILYRSAICFPLYLVPAFIIDYLNRDQKQNTAPNAKTVKGNDYTKVNMGEKWGAVLGGVFGTLSLLINLKKIMANCEKNGIKHSPIAGLVINAAAGALGGHWLGKITDKYTNKQAAKVADEQK